MVQERDKKKFLRLFALSAVKKQENTQQNAKKDSCSSCYPLAKQKYSVGKRKNFVSFVLSVGKNKNK